MTKTEYRKYISSEAWQQRRKEFLMAYSDCGRCSIPRWIAVIAYDQDLHVHHRNYARVGAELDDDLEPLCKRCHEIETFGTSTLHQVRASLCRRCGGNTWNTVDNVCGGCEAFHPCEASYAYENNRIFEAKVSSDGEILAEFLQYKVLPEIILQKAGATQE